MLSRFLLGASVGGIAVYVWDDEIRRFANTKGRTGIGIGAVILDQIVPGAGRIAPIAGALIERKYGRNEEYEADRHGVELLERVGRNKDVMINTLAWLKNTGGDGGGGFFSTHPATGDRIEVLRRL
jgi:predicted Zn-dependent protease